MEFTWKHGGLCGLVLVGLVGGFAWQSSGAPPSSHSVNHHAALEEAAEGDTISEDAALLTSAHSPLDSDSSERTAAEVDHQDVHHDEGEHPHPITPAHERIFAENRTIQALNDSMALRNVNKMRELLSEYRKLDPEDAEATQAGYAVVADCIEFPGSSSLEAASRFYDEERHSPLRRFVRRICFENAD